MIKFQFETLSSEGTSSFTTIDEDDDFHVQPFSAAKAFFWSKQQFNIIQSDQKRVFFTSEFGTGKTTLMKTKAKELSRQINAEIAKGNKSMNSPEQKVFFVLFCDSNSLLAKVIEQEFKAEKRIEVVVMPGQNVEIDLNNNN